MNIRNLKRRDFTRTMTMAGIGSLVSPVVVKGQESGNKSSRPSSVEKFRLSLNAYSFDKPLRTGTFTISDLIDFCSETGFDGVDLTGYYFPGYPAVPSDDFIHSVKKKAFLSGLYINGTGVRNDFTWSDPQKRYEEKKLVKDWIVVAQKLGAPSIRIFSGNLSKENYTWKERAKWIADDIQECAEYGKEHGVMIALQNHNDFVRNASEVEELLRLVNSEWVGLMLDIGSYHTDDPYDDIARTSKYAISWQLKENVFIKDKQVETDYSKIIDIVRKCNYRGYLPLETLGEGDPAVKVEVLLKKVRKIIEA
jgi:sugar phosphate isomerase/epimerase